MKIISKTKYNDDYLLIVEVIDPIAITHCINRYNLILNRNGKNIFPKNKYKFFKFNENSDIYKLKSALTNDYIYINQLLYHKLKICDKTFDDCLNTMNEYLNNNQKIYTMYKNFKYNI